MNTDKYYKVKAESVKKTGLCTLRYTTADGCYILSGSDLKNIENGGIIIPDANKEQVSRATARKLIAENMYKKGNE